MRLRLAIIVVVLVILTLRAGNYLVVDHPRKSDVILVLAGETERRPSRGAELLAQGYGSKLILDVPKNPQFYGHTQVELAQSYIETLPEPKRVSLCPITGLSTMEEARDTESCLAAAGGHSVLLVTTDFHTRRALSIFRRTLPGYDISVAATPDPRQFGPNWWTSRQWAKVTFEEWTRLAWWQLVDRWRS